MKRVVSNSVVAFLLMLIMGCGFHLRGAADLSDNLKVMHIEGLNLQRDIGLYLKRGLVSNGITVVDQPQADSAELKIIENQFDRRVLSVGSNAKVSEYELYARIRFSVLDAQGKTLAEGQSVEAQRDYQFDEDEVLGRESEEALLRDQLNKELVQSLLRRLSAIK
jgi:LPS-assembly lipoprotein